MHEAYNNVQYHAVRTPTTGNYYVNYYVGSSDLIAANRKYVLEKTFNFSIAPPNTMGFRANDIFNFICAENNPDVSPISCVHVQRLSVTDSIGKE